MRLKDPTEWFEDLNVHLEDQDIIDQAAALEPTLFYAGSKAAAAAWLVLAAAIGGAFGGFTLSPQVRSSIAVFIAYLVAGVLLLRFFKPLSARRFGESVAWQATLVLFWSFLLAVIAVAAGRIDRTWLAYLASTGGGLFIGMMYGSLNPGFIKREDLWMSAAFPLGGLSTALATALYRRLAESGAVPAAAVLVGATVAVVFMLPMAVLMARLWNESHGLGQMATLYLHNDNFTPQAIEYLDRALAIAPEDADLYNLRGIAFSKLGDSERAEADWRKVMELAPKAAESHMNRGVDFMVKGDFDAAIDALHAAIRIDPKHATAHSNLGTAHQKKGELDRAVEYYTRAIELKPDYAKAFSNRAYSYFLKGEHQLALADCTRALKLEPNLPMAYVNRGHALAALGANDEAESSFRVALDMDPEPSVAEEALDALEKLVGDEPEAENA